MCGVRFKLKCEWKECNLGDLVTFQRGYDLPKTKMKKGKYKSQFWINDKKVQKVFFTITEK